MALWGERSVKVAGNAPVLGSSAEAAVVQIRSASSGVSTRMASMIRNRGQGCTIETMTPGRDQQKRQAAAIPFREDGGRIEVLLIRRKDKPWGIPKGNIDTGRSARESALNEAREEAGI